MRDDLSSFADEVRRRAAGSLEAQASVGRLRSTTPTPRFHLALVSRCPNQRMLAQVAQLLEHSQRFQMVRVGDATRGGDARAEHRRLAEFAASGSVDAAVSMLRQHLESTLSAVVAEWR